MPRVIGYRLTKKGITEVIPTRSFTFEALATLYHLRHDPEDDPRVKLKLLDIKVACIFEREVIETKFPGITSRFVLATKQYRELIVVRYLNRRLLISRLLQIIQLFTRKIAIIVRIICLILSP